MAETGSPWQQQDLLGLLGVGGAVAASAGHDPAAEAEGHGGALNPPQQAIPLDNAPARQLTSLGQPSEATEAPSPAPDSPEVSADVAAAEWPRIASAPEASSAVPVPEPPLSLAATATASSPAAPAPTAPPPMAPPPAAPELPPLAASSRRAAPLTGGLGFPERILILDTETTALSPEEGACIEVGAVLFHVPSRQVLQQLSFLLPCAANPAEPINAIPAAVSCLPQPVEPALACFAALVDAADAVVAHNASFDRQWFGRGRLPALRGPWICSMEDIRWPPDRRLRANPSVRDLALAYGVPVWAAHRALTDCQYLVHVLARCADLEALLAEALEPRRLYRARLSYAERHRAREAGFRWNEPVAGAWSRRLSQREVEALSFAVVAVEAEEERMDPLPRAS